jgi:hypothetical protein
MVHFCRRPSSIKPATSVLPAAQRSSDGSTQLKSASSVLAGLNEFDSCMIEPSATRKPPPLCAATWRGRQQSYRFGPSLAFDS